ncbi:nidogen-2-like, partial [Sinocyclocheilus rhinocerous]
ILILFCLLFQGSIVVGIDYDCRERKVYWTDLAGRTINRASLEPGSEPEIIINIALTSPEGLAIDVARRRLFWVDSTSDKIETTNLDGSDRRVLFDTDLVNPRAIIVDSPTGTLYWTDWNREAPKIESSSVDGQNRRVLVQDGIGLPNALTYDSTTRQVCWADAGTKRLECISPNGTGRRVVHSNLSYPFSMVAFANHYYYTDWRRDGVIALSRDNQSTDEHLPDQRSHLYGITVAPPHCL